MNVPQVIFIVNINIITSIGNITINPFTGNITIINFCIMSLILCCIIIMTIININICSLIFRIKLAGSLNIYRGHSFEFEPQLPLFVLQNQNHVS